MRPESLSVRLGATQYVFGWGSASQVARLASDRGDGTLIATSPGAAARTALIGELQAQLHGGVRVFDQIQPNPDVDHIDRAAEVAADAQLIVGIGGGSVMDAAKALAVVAASPLGAAEWLELGRVPDETPRKNLILVPTTAGTGSELSHGAILSDPTRDFKGGLRGARLAPDVAVVDPALSVTAPGELTARTAFDITCHAFESFVSKRSNSAARMLALDALDLVSRSAARAVASPADRDARSDLSYASSLMGLNLASVGTCLPHRLQYAFGGVDAQLSHAEGLAWIYPVWLRHAFGHASDALRALFPVLGLRVPENPGQAAEGMRDWLAGLGLATQVPRDERFTVDRLARLTLGPFEVDPIPNAGEQVLPILREILA